jgi:hypothetical protein
MRQKQCYQKDVRVTRRSIVEYAEAVRGRYFRAPKKAKTEMLNEFVATTGIHRKAVIRLLNRRSRFSGSKKKGRPRSYRHEAMVALKVAWEASDCMCSRRLQPFPPELVGILKRCGELTMLIKEQRAHGRKKRELADTYGALNPVTLLQQIRRSVEKLRALVERQRLESTR